MEAHVWDAGLARSTHQEYDGIGGSNRFSIGDGSTSLHFHSAHVTGTIIASGFKANAKGMAPQADAVGYNWNSDMSEATTAANNGMLLSNHSYGWGASAIPDWYFGAYLYESRNWDIILHNAPYYLMVVAAGNDGNDNTSNGNPLDGNSSYDKLSGQATSKNNLVVANAQDANIDANGNLISVNIRSSSSEGPTDDYRIKPDITGNGSGLYSTYHNSDNAYNSISGTSMASPNVCGTLLLLQQHYNNINSGFMRAATLKGLALHTADDAGPAGPDAVWGWGLLNGKDAANAITNNDVESTIIELTLNQGNSYSVNVDSDGINDLIASISWTDPAGTANWGTANDPTPALVNDLDIRVTQAASTYYPYRLTSITTNANDGDNIVDPFEKVIISGASGTYTITVTHKGSLSGGSQNFSLIVTGKASIPSAPLADFSADNTTPAVGQTVTFTDLSSNSPTSWSWSFNPSTVTYVVGNSNSQNPQVQFNNNGVYTVSLTSTNTIGSDDETKTDYIYAGTPGLWTGLSTQDWNTASNWHNYLVPPSSQDVTIPAGLANWPSYNGNLVVGTHCNDIVMNGASELTVTGDLTISPGKTLTNNSNSTIHIDGDWTNYGTFNEGLSTVDFTGTNNSIINTPPGEHIYLINESFNNFPESWNGDLGNGQGQFRKRNTSFAGGPSPEARFRRLGGNNTATKRMYYNVLNTSGLSSLTLDFMHAVDDRNGSIEYTLKVEYSTDQTNWFDAGWSVSPTEDIPATPVSLNLSSAQGVGSSTLYIAFTVTGKLKNIKYWYIDNVQLHYNTIVVQTFYNLTDSKAGAEVITNGYVTMNNDMIVKPGAYFTNSTGNTINVAGNVLFEGNSSAKASFIDNGIINVTGTTSVQSYYTDNRWHFLSSPVSNAVSNIFLDIYLKEWNENNYTWTFITATDYPLEVGKGFEIWSELGNPIIDYTGGALNTGNISPAVTATDDNGGGIGADEGWNFVGNPFPSAIDLGEYGNVFPGYTWTNLDYTVYLWNGVQYASYNPNTDPPSSTNGGTRYVPSMQSFFVKAHDFNPAITIPNSARVHNAQANYKISDDQQTIRLRAEGNGYSDEMLIMANKAATNGFDSDFDAYKLMGIEQAPQIYSVNTDIKLSINVLEKIVEEDVIEIGFNVGEDGEYTIIASEILNFENFEVVLLEDLLTNTWVDILENPVYEFYASQEGPQTRFRLHFSSPMGVQPNYQQALAIYSHSDIIFIHTPVSIDGNVVVYNMMGQQILKQQNLGEGLNPIRVKNGTGYYLVKVYSGSKVYAQKVFIR
jgi:PKD repeat protein